MFAAIQNRNKVVLDELAVYRHFFDAFTNVFLVMHRDAQQAAAEAADGLEAIPGGRDAGIHPQAVVFGAQAENVLSPGLLAP